MSLTTPPTGTLGHDHPVDPERVAAARERLIDAEEAGRLAWLLGLLADPVRARILSALDLVQELCVGDLSLALEATEDSVGYIHRRFEGEWLPPSITRGAWAAGPAVRRVR